MPYESYPPPVWDGTTEVLESVVDLKARYCKYLDDKDWDRWASLFLPGATLQVGPSKTAAIRGQSAIRKQLSTTLRRARTHHEARDPELREGGLGRMRVIWRMKDRVDTPLYLLEGAGFYDDVYEETPQGLRIASLRLHRTRVDLEAKSVLMRGVLHAHRVGLLKRLAPEADRSLGQALYVGLRPGERP